MRDTLRPVTAKSGRWSGGGRHRGTELARVRVGVTLVANDRLQLTQYGFSYLEVFSSSIESGNSLAQLRDLAFNASEFFRDSLKQLLAVFHSQALGYQALCRLSNRAHARQHDRHGHPRSSRLAESPRPSEARPSECVVLCDRHLLP
jgi:hypothetical protein